MIGVVIMYPAVHRSLHVRTSAGTTSTDQQVHALPLAGLEPGIRIHPLPVENARKAKKQVARNSKMEVARALVSVK